MSGRDGWGAKCVAALAALGLLTHCGEAPGGVSDEPLRSYQPPGIQPPELQPPTDTPNPHAPPWPDLPPPSGGSGGAASTAWVKHYGGKGLEKLHALATDAAGGFVAAGLFGDAPFAGGTGFALARYAADGTPEWTRQVSVEHVRVKSLTVTPEGNILVVGSYDGTPDLGAGPLPEALLADGGLFIAKFSPHGTTTWTRGFVASDSVDAGGVVRRGLVHPEAVATDVQGSLLVVGRFHNRVSLGGPSLFAGTASFSADEALGGGFIAKFDWRGEHVWSRAIEAQPNGVGGWPRTVSATLDGKVLVGGRVSAGASLGGGSVSVSSPFIARYGDRGQLEWVRPFVGATPIHGEVLAVQALSTGDVAFAANMGGTFPFNGRTYVGGHLGGEALTNGFTGILRTSGSDGWLMDLAQAQLGGLVATSHGAYAVTGVGHGLRLGGQLVSSPRGESDTPFVANILAGGGVAWIRSLDSHFTGGLQGQGTSRLQLAAQPGERLLLGGDFSELLLHEGASYTTRGASDLFYLQLGP